MRSAATCHHARPPYYVQTAGMAMAWDVCLCLGRRVVSSPCLPRAVVRHAWSSLYRHVDAATDGQAYVCIACLDGNYRPPCACVMTPAPRRRPLR